MQFSEFENQLGQELLLHSVPSDDLSLVSESNEVSQFSVKAEIYMTCHLMMIGINVG